MSRLIPITPALAKQNAATIAGIALALDAGSLVTVQQIAHRAGISQKKVRQQLTALQKVAKMHEVVQDWTAEEAAEQLELKIERQQAAIASKTPKTHEQWIAGLVKKFGQKLFDEEYPTWKRVRKDQGKELRRNDFEFWINRKSKDVVVVEPVKQKPVVDTVELTAAQILDAIDKGRSADVPRSKWPANLRHMNLSQLQALATVSE